jgi:hypothetical protein
MALPLMPKATAVWLVDNTTLTFDQIAEFTGMHELEVQAIADEEVAIGIVGVNPTLNGQLTSEEIKRGEDKGSYRLKLRKSDIPKPKVRSKGARYTPVSKRQERPDAIAWIIKHHPELADSQVSRLLGTTKPTINSIRDRSHWNIQAIKPQNPVTLGLCNEPELQKALALAARKAEKAGIILPKAKVDLDERTEPQLIKTKPPAPKVTAENLFRPSTAES